MTVAGCIESALEVPTGLFPAGNLRLLRILCVHTLVISRLEERWVKVAPRGRRCWRGEEAGSRHVDLSDGRAGEHV